MLWDGHEQVRQGKLDEARKNIDVTVHDEGRSASLVRYEFTKVRPVR